MYRYRHHRKTKLDSGSDTDDLQHLIPDDTRATMSQPEQPASNLTELTADIVSAYVTHNSVQSGDLAGLIAVVHAALQGLGTSQQPEAERPQPAVAIRKSVTPDFLISLEDGKPYKTLKRHLAKLGLTPEDYREKWGLARDYPMVAANYAQKRSELAKGLGLGQSRKQRAAAATASVQETLSGPAEATGPSQEETSAAPAETARPKRRARQTDRDERVRP
jgi:predicted transcriptional regulator